ncbi:MAG: hypothetical protein AVDCRST_MAG64-2619, partial [uncultured Phycisphaerae bacterium]
ERRPARRRAAARPPTRAPAAAAEGPAAPAVGVPEPATAVGVGDGAMGRRGARGADRLRLPRVPLLRRVRVLRPAGAGVRL